MPLPERNPWKSLFVYSDAAHVRRHGPVGYTDDENYKPWLRDEFMFRCLYCLCREAWFPDGDHHFSVEHLEPTSLAPAGLTDYDTLVYACCQCNAARQAISLPLDVLGDSSRHLQVNSDGSILGLTPEGIDFIRVCRLDRPILTAFRRLMLETLAYLDRKREPEAKGLLRRYLGFPANLPNLAALRPPGGNRRPEGIDASAYARRSRSELPDVY